MVTEQSVLGVVSCCILTSSAISAVFLLFSMLMIETGVIFSACFFSCVYFLFFQVHKFWSSWLVKVRGIPAYVQYGKRG